MNLLDWEHNYKNSDFVSMEPAFSAIKRLNSFKQPSF